MSIIFLKKIPQKNKIDSKKKMGICCSANDEKARRQRPGIHPAQEYAVRPLKTVKGADGIEREVEASENGTAYSALNTEEASEIGRLSRADSVSKMTAEPSSIMMTLRRKFIVTRAMLQHGINEDVDQFNGEIQESIADMREKDRRRVREWLDSVSRALRGRAPSEFPPVNPKKDRGGGGLGGKRKGGAEGIMSTHPHTSRGGSPGTQSLMSHLSPSAAIEEEFKPVGDSSGGGASATTTTTPAKRFSLPVKDTQSESTAESNDQGSTGAAIMSTSVPSRDGGGNGSRAAYSPLNGENPSTSSNNFNNDPSSPSSTGAASRNRSRGGDDSVKANVDGELNSISHKKPSAASLGH